MKDKGPFNGKSQDSNKYGIKTIEDEDLDNVTEVETT